MSKARQLLINNKQKKSRNGTTQLQLEQKNTTGKKDGK